MNATFTSKKFIKQLNITRIKNRNLFAQILLILFATVSFILCSLNTNGQSDDCSIATTLIPSVSCSPTPGTTVNATQSIPAITCASFTGTADDDVWYQFVATSPIHNIIVAGDADFDAVIDVRSGSCNGTNIGCADGTTSGGTETVSLSSLIVGNTYLIRVYSFGSSAVSQGTFTICLTSPAPTNDNCANAIVLTPGISCSPIAGTTVDATQSIPAITCATFTGTADDDVWYQFVATSPIHNIIVAGGAGFDAVIDVRSGSCNGTNIGCADGTTSGGTETVSLSTLTVGNTYLIRLYGFGASVSSQGTFTICVTSPAPTNDNCSGAIALTPGTSCISIAGTTVGATQSIPAITCATFTGTADDDVWYQFVATSTVHNVTVAGDAGFDAVIDIRSGACNGTNIGCADFTTAGGTETVSLSTLTVGNTYFIRLYGFGASVSSQGTFTICVTSPAPTNDNCSGAISLTPGAFCLPVAGTTVGATQSLPALTCATFTGTADDDVWYQFVATSTIHDVKVGGDAGFDAVVDIRSGSCNGTNIACADATVSAGVETVTLGSLIPGNSYLIRLYSFGSAVTSQGTFTICVTTPAPANDDCSNAISLIPGTTCLMTSGTSVRGTQSIPAIACGSFTGTADDDVWYKFVATSASHNILVEGETGFDAVVDLRSGACNGINIGCADLTAGGGTETISATGLTIGNTYFVRVYSFGSTPPTEGEFSICIGVVSCTLTCPADLTVSNDGNLCGAMVSFPEATTSGSCGTRTATPPSGSFFPIGLTTVNVSEEGGQECSFTVRVNDTQAPVITCPVNITVNNDPNQCGALVNFTATATDNCPSVTFTSNPASGTFFPVGTTTVTYTATDNSSNTSTCSFTVTVVDTQVPVITCPTDITVCGSQVITFSNPLATDNCTGVVVTQSLGLLSGSVFPVGNTTNKFIARDVSGNEVFCTMVVTVNPIPLPVITSNTGMFSICKHSSIILNAGTYSSYSWSTGATTQKISTGSAGTYTVTVTNGSGCTATASATTVINKSISNKPGKISGAIYGMCSTSGTYSISPVSGAVSYLWTVASGGGATIASGQGTTSVNINFGNFNTATVSVRAVNGCGQSAVRTLSVKAKPIAPLFIFGEKNGVCQKTNVVYSIDPVPGATYYHWSIPSKVSLISGQGSNSIVVNFLNSFSSATICVTAQNACGISSSTSIDLNSKPATPVVINGPSGVCRNQTGAVYSTPSVFGATSYIWTVPRQAQIISGQGTSSIVVNFSRYAEDIKVKARNNCGTSSERSIKVRFSCRESELENFNNVNAINVYPNPVHENLNVSISSDKRQKCYLKIVDVTGKQLLFDSFITDEGLNTYQYDVTKYSSGFYLMVIEREDTSVETFRVIIE